VRRGVGGGLKLGDSKKKNDTFQYNLPSTFRPRYNSLEMSKLYNQYLEDKQTKNAFNDHISFSIFL
jgi:hypothetical protein